MLHGEQSNPYGTHALGPLHSTARPLAHCAGPHLASEGTQAPLQHRATLLHAPGAAGSSDLPDLTNEGLLASAGSWMAPFLGGVRTRQELARVDWSGVLRGMVGDGVLVMLMLVRGASCINLGVRIMG